MGKLFSVLKTRGAFDNSLIAVMADHGEAFGEHGENHHGIFLYDETIHVPMLFKLPGRHAAATVDAPVGLVDVTPSILQAVHLPVPAAVQGKSLMKFMASGTQPASQKESGFGFAAPGLCREPLWSPLVWVEHTEGVEDREVPLR